MKEKPTYLGIDLGSISLKVVLLSHEKEVLFSRWVRVAGRPYLAACGILGELVSKFPEVVVNAVGVTGSGRALFAESLGALPVNEIIAQACATGFFHSKVRSIIEIGGQDSKFIALSPAISDFRMNELCAAGTGAFLDQQAARLGLSIEEFSQLGLDAKNPVDIAGRCAVFAKSDMTHHQQEGKPLADIVAGLNNALVRSYMSNLVRGREIQRPVAFQGAVAANVGLVEAFRKILGLDGDDLIVPENYRVMGAIGAAIKAADSKKCERFTLKEIAERVVLLSKTDNETDKARSFHPKLKESPLLSQAKTLCETTSEGETPSPPLTRRLPTPVSQRALSLEQKRAGLNLDGAYLGIDVGSVSAKIAVIAGDSVVYSDYRFLSGLPLQTVKALLDGLKNNFDTTKITGVGITGSGRNFIGMLIGADVIINEITAQCKGAMIIHPEVDTIIEIGGQDAKFIALKNGSVTYFAMNRVCAAGTGAFLQEQAARLNIDLEREFSEIAFRSDHPAVLGSRCTVFMESDLVSHQQQGLKKEDLVAGLAISVVENYLEKVVAGYSIGDSILFLGGVAKNRAVVSALNAKLKKEIVTSDIGGVSGAVGAAICAFEGRVRGIFRQSSARLDIADLKFEQFSCHDCPNSCVITQGPKGLTLGGRCGKWDSSKKAKVGKESLLKLRENALFENLLFRGKPLRETTSEGETPSPPPKAAVPLPSLSESLTPKQKITIGIPRALFTFDRLPLWRTFFESIGCNVLLSPKSSVGLFSEGMKHLVVETCLPVKSFCCHIVALNKNKDVDYVFVPSFVTTGIDRHNRETHHCPYIQGLIQFALPLCSKPMLKPVINWRLNPKDEELEMIKVALSLGVKKEGAVRAWRAASSELSAFRATMRGLGDDVIDKLKTGKLARAFVLLGKDYNISDASLNSSAAKILEGFGETLITQDMIASDDGAYDESLRAMYWSHGKEMIAAAEVAAVTPNLFAVLITSFGCGPDSFTLSLIKEVLKDKPLLVLEVDEHSSSVGMETRIEAFLDLLKKDIKPQSKPLRIFKQPSNKIKRVFLPNFSDHGLAFASAIKTLGLEPALTDLPDEQVQKIGAEHATSGECHPFTLMLGGYIKAARENKGSDDACYFMPESASCRVGMFGAQMQLIVNKLGLNLPICTRIEDLTPSIHKSNLSTFIKATLSYWEIIRGCDFLMQKYFETRAYEVDKGAADRAHDEGLKEFTRLVFKGKPQKGLEAALAILDDVKVDLSQLRVKIGITGDYYTRVCGFSNNEIFRDIETLGGVVLLPPTMSEFIKYNSYQRPKAALSHRNMREFVQSLLIRSVVSSREERVRKIFGSKISYDIPVDYKRAAKLVENYIDIKLPAGLTAAVAAIMEQINAGASGILSLITFHCNYGLVIGSVMSLIDRDFPDIPKLTLIFEGLKPTHNRTRLEAFMERVHDSAKRRASKIIL